MSDDYDMIPPIRLSIAGRTFDQIHVLVSVFFLQNETELCTIAKVN